MDPVRNPFAPGAGNPPPELAGRQGILASADTMLARVEQGRHAKSFMLIGLRGVGKTVLLNRIRQMAEDRKLSALMIESPEDKGLPDLLVPALRRLLLGLDRGLGATEAAKRGMRILSGFAKSLKLKVGDIEFGIDTEKGVADTGDLDQDLPDVLVAVGEAAKARKTAIVLLIDELQYIKERELSALIMGIHKVSQLQLPLVLVAAGLPQLVGNMGRSKSYAERLFDFPDIGPLNKTDATTAIVGPITQEGETISAPAVTAILKSTQGYPFFLQVWGFSTWNEAKRSPISARDVAAAEPKVLKSLDDSFFRVRFDRLTPSEKKYLRAMAELGPGPHRSGDVAELRNVKVQTVAPIRSSLIAKGMIYSPAHGDTAFTVPLFDEFLKRQLPEMEKG
jgi:AAA ATPase domain